MAKVECNENVVSVTPSSSIIICSKCNATFLDARHLQEHHRKCYLIPIKNNFLCSTCNKVFATKSRLQNHTRIHTGVKPFTCSVCHKAFADRSASIKHEKIHFRVKDDKVECNLCGGLFSDSWGLKKHQLTHSGERPYECPMCHKTFRTSSTLVVHKRIHTGEKPYACTHCEKRFTVKTHLVTHNRTHSGERPYKCNSCGRAFSDRSSWRRHSRRHDTNPIGDTAIQCKFIYNDYNNVSAIESLQNFVTEQYKKTDNQLEESNKTGLEAIDHFMSFQKPLFENFHRFILEHQVKSDVEKDPASDENLTKDKQLVINPLYKSSRISPLENKCIDIKTDSEDKTITENNSSRIDYSRVQTLPVSINSEQQCNSPAKISNYHSSDAVPDKNFHYSHFLEMPENDKTHYSFNQFHALTNVISIPTTATLQRSSFKFLNESKNTNVNNYNTTNFSPIYSSAINLIDNSTTIFNSDKNVLSRRS